MRSSDPAAYMNRLDASLYCLPGIFGSEEVIVNSEEVRCAASGTDLIFREISHVQSTAR